MHNIQNNECYSICLNTNSNTATKKLGILWLFAPVLVLFLLKGRYSNWVVHENAQRWQLLS
jgi:hypothetical protein